MVEKKNKVAVLIEDCRYCPNASLKFIPELEEDVMFCQTTTSCLFLRKGYGSRAIPNWCPRLNRQKKLCGKRAKIPGIVS